MNYDGFGCILAVILIIAAIVVMGMVVSTIF
jgi:hypothetical protein